MDASAREGDRRIFGPEERAGVHDPALLRLRFLRPPPLRPRKGHDDRLAGNLLAGRKGPEVAARCGGSAIPGLEKGRSGTGTGGTQVTIGSSVLLPIVGPRSTDG